MAKKKQDKVTDNDLTEDPKVIAKVDAMMSTGRDRPELETESKSVDEFEKLQPEPSESSPPPLDIFADTPSAPLLNEVKTKPKRAAHKVKIAVEEVTEADEEGRVEVNEIPKEEVKPLKVDNYDDPQTAQAINAIVAEEADTTLGVQDAELEQVKAESAPAQSSHAAAWFWVLVVIVCLVAIGMAIYLIDPNMHVSLSSIKHHL
jgi:hypothetical protein